MGAGIDPSAGSFRVEDNKIQTRGRVRRAAVGTRGHLSDHDTAATRDIKRAYRTIRGGKTSEVRIYGRV